MVYCHLVQLSVWNERRHACIRRLNTFSSSLCFWMKKNIITVLLSLYCSLRFMNTPWSNVRGHLFLKISVFPFLNWLSWITCACKNMNNVICNLVQFKGHWRQSLCSPTWFKFYYLIDNVHKLTSKVNKAIRKQ